MGNTLSVRELVAAGRAGEACDLMYTNTTSSASTRESMPALEFHHDGEWVGALAVEEGVSTNRLIVLGDNDFFEYLMNDGARASDLERYVDVARRMVVSNEVAILDEVING